MDLDNLSVIIPMYNAAAYIEEAIGSVLSQTYRPAEIIVVDDGSTDSSAGVVSRFKEVTLLKKPHSGVNATLNAGLDAAKSAYIAFLDADDRWIPSKTEIQFNLLVNNEALDMVFGHAERFQMVEENGNSVEKKIDVLAGVGVQGGMFKRRVFDRIGNFSSQPDVHQFLDWYAKAKEAGMSILIHNEIVFERRIHGGNTSILQKDFQLQRYFNALKASIDRRRNAG